MNKAVKTKLDKIIDYAKSSESWGGQLFVFGEALTDNRESAIIRLAAGFDKEFDDEDRFGDMLDEVDEITDGHFELLIMNSDNLTSYALHEIKNGEIIYDSLEQDRCRPVSGNQDFN